MTLREIEQKIRNFLSGQADKQGEELFNKWYHSIDEKLPAFSNEEKREIKSKSPFHSW